MTSHPLPIIELRDISLCYDSRERPVLEDINLGIHRGDFVAITGPNGGGKTSLLRIILRLLKPSSGQVIYRRDNRDVRCLPIGYSGPHTEVMPIGTPPYNIAMRCHKTLSFLWYSIIFGLHFY